MIMHLTPVRRLRDSGLWTEGSWARSRTVRNAPAQRWSAGRGRVLHRFEASKATLKPSLISVDPKLL